MAEPTAAEPPAAVADLMGAFPGESEMACRMRAHDWPATELGAPAHWPQGLRFAVRLCLASRFPVVLWWGPRLCMLCNDAYLPFLGEDRRARALMQPGREVWGEGWDAIRPVLEGVVATGGAAGSEDEELFLERKLSREEVFVSASYSPILGADGRTVEGVYCTCAETTGKVIGARRLETLRKLGARSKDEAPTVQSVCEQAAAVLRQNPRDVAFAAIYVGVEREARLAAAVLPEDGHRLPACASGAQENADAPWPLAAVLRTKEAVDCLDLEAKGVRIRGGRWPELTRQAIVLPMQGTPLGPCGLLVAGVSPRAPLDAAYRSFFALAAAHIGSAISLAQACEAQRGRALSAELAGVLGAALEKARLAPVSEARMRDELHTDLAAMTAQEKLRRSEERFRRFFELGLIGGALTSPDKGCLEVNDELCRMLGYPREELLLKSWTQMTHPDDLAADVAQFERVLAGEIDGYLLDKRWIRKDGSVIDSIMAARAVRRADGTVEYLVALVQDITARRRAEESLQRLQADVAHVARVATMGEMASSIAHEVNQPLAAIAANASACARWLAMEPANLGEANAAVMHIARDAGHASRVVARIRAFVQRREMQRSPLDLAEVTREAVAMAQAEIRAHGVCLSLALTAGLPPVLGDRVHLQQVILNLLKNALEAMEPSSERQRVLAVTVAAFGGDTVGVAVRDCGTGLGPGQRERLFDAFHTTKPGGMGMGLAISRSIIEAHGGRLWGDNNEGPGATFQFTLPAAAAGFRQS